MEDNKCARCGNEFRPRHFYDNGNPMDTGYGTNPEDNRRYCFECCGLLDLEHMRKDGKYDLYLSQNAPKGAWVITNWPGTLRIQPAWVSYGHHNIAGSRLDAWFILDGYVWHGVNIGDNQVLRCKRTKSTDSRKSTVILPEGG